MQNIVALVPAFKMASTASRRRVGLVYGEDGLFRRAGCVVVDMDAKAVSC